MDYSSTESLEENYSSSTLIDFEILLALGEDNLDNLVHEDQLEYSDHDDINNDYDEFIQQPVPSDITYSTEQQLIIDATVNKQDVIVNAVAGSGKTTTILGIARATNASILNLTYNKKLKLEVQNKIKKNRLTNIHCFSFHSFMYKYYPCNGKYDDVHMTRLIKARVKNQYPIPFFEHIIIDECQDMINIYYQFICKVIEDLREQYPDYHPTITLFGDARQCIYGYKGADSRYLTGASYLYGRDFKIMSLNQSFRLTKPVAQFINKYVFGSDIIYSDKSGCPVQYIECNVFTYMDILCDKIIKLLDQGYKPDDIFVLQATVKNLGDRNPIKILENKLVDQGILCYFSNNDEYSEENDEVLKNKVVFSNFHQTKGLERKVVIIVGFDLSYYRYYARDSDDRKCANPLYVAMTRAMERLYLIQGSTRMKFIDDTVKSVPFVKFHREGRPKPLDSNGSSPSLSVTKLCNHLTHDKIMKILEPLNNMYIPVREQINNTKTPSLVSDDKSVENISVINALGINACFEYQILGTSWFIDQNNRAAQSNNPEILYKNIKEKWETVEQDFTIPFWLKTANVYYAKSEGVLFLLEQVSDYNWFNEEEWQTIQTQMRETIGRKLLFEEPVSKVMNNHCRTLCGRIDIVDEDTVWEIKYTNSLTLEHKLQLMCYAYLVEHEKHKFKNIKYYKLYNTKTGEVLLLNYNAKVAETIIEELFKQYNSTDRTDTEFYADNNKERQDFYDAETAEKVIDQIYEPAKPSVKKLTCDILKQMLKDNQIRFSSKARKDELIQLCEQHSLI